MSDGVTLFADVYRPQTDDLCPVLLMRTPYGRASPKGWFAHPYTYAAHGYMVVAQDCRGRGQSEGTYDSLRHEAQDGYETVEWAAGLAGADGRVGTYGFSYDGLIQMLTAALQPPSLVAIAPAFINSKSYDNYFQGGALALGLNVYAMVLHECGVARHEGDMETYERLLAAARDVPTLCRTLPLRELPTRLGISIPWWGERLDHPTYDEYWRENHRNAQLDRINVPALHLGGWYDLCVRGTIESFLTLCRNAVSNDARKAQKLLLGPWCHSPGPPIHGSREEDGWKVVDEWTLRWYDHHLKGEANGVLDAPVTTYVLGHGWEDLDGWPSDRAQSSSYYFHSGGRANGASGDGVMSAEAPQAELFDVYVYDPTQANMPAGGHSCCDASVTPMGAACQNEAESSPSVLVYTNAPFEENGFVIGDVTVVLFASSDAADTDFTARLCIVDENGCSRNLQEGIVRARYRESLSQPIRIDPGAILKYEIDVGPVATKISRGQRVRVDIASADFPQWDRNLNTGGELGSESLADAVVATQRIYHDEAHPSHLLLPWTARLDHLKRKAPQPVQNVGARSGMRI